MTETDDTQNISSEHPHPKFVRWIIFTAALLPFIVTIAYMTFKPDPIMLKRNFPPPVVAPDTSP